LIPETFYLIWKPGGVKNARRHWSLAQSIESNIKTHQFWYW
jgi:hypothetical protein